MSNSIDISDEQKERSAVFVRFIDILFAVVLGQSFVFLSSERGVSVWIAAPSQNLVALADVCLAYACGNELGRVPLLNDETSNEKRSSVRD